MRPQRMKSFAHRYGFQEAFIFLYLAALWIDQYNCLDKYELQATDVNSQNSLMPQDFFLRP